MPRTILRIEYDYDFYLLALVSPIKDYRLCWMLNRSCDLDLKELGDLEINSHKNKKLVYFSVFEYKDDINQAHYNVISNKLMGEWLIPELKEADYFMMLRGNTSVKERESLLEKVKMDPEIQMAFEVDPTKLKSRQNLLLE